MSEIEVTGLSAEDKEANYDELDPGIRETVRWLRFYGFDTHDSGDGKTKLEDGDTRCVETVANVHMAVANPEEMVKECTRLRDLLKSRGVKLKEIGPNQAPHIQGSYDPVRDAAIISLWCVDDELLANSLPEVPVT